MYTQISKTMKACSLYLGRALTLELGFRTGTTKKLFLIEAIPVDTPLFLMPRECIAHFLVRPSGRLKAMMDYKRAVVADRRRKVDSPVNSPESCLESIYHKIETPKAP